MLFIFNLPTGGLTLGQGSNSDRLYWRGNQEPNVDCANHNTPSPKSEASCGRIRAPGRPACGCAAFSCSPSRPGHQPRSVARRPADLGRPVASCLCSSAPLQKPGSRLKQSDAASPKSRLWCFLPFSRCATARRASCWRSISTPKPHRSSTPALTLRPGHVLSPSSPTNILAMHFLVRPASAAMRGRSPPATCRARTGSGPSSGVSGRITATLRPPP